MLEHIRFLRLTSIALVQLVATMKMLEYSAGSFDRRRIGLSA